MLSQAVVNIAYLIAAVLFILDLKWMSHPRTAVRGNRAGILGMAIAVVATVIGPEFAVGGFAATPVIIGVLIGAAIGGVSGLLMTGGASMMIVSYCSCASSRKRGNSCFKRNWITAGSFRPS